MEMEQRAEQMIVWLIFTFLISMSFKDRMPTFDYGVKGFLDMHLCYGIPFSWNLFLIIFIIMMGLVCFLVDFDKFLKIKKKDE
jgi:uncharacterized membrane protein